MSIDHVYSTISELLPMEHASNPIQKVIGYPRNYLATIVPVSISCLTHHYYRMQSSALVKTIDCFFSL